MQDGTSFEELFELFEEKNIPYISLDLPGFWSSALLHDTMTIEEYCNVVKNLIEKLGLEKPILVGHSFGWRISIYLGSFYNNIEKIVLIGSAGIAPEMNPLRLAVVKAWKVIFSLPWLTTLWATIKKKASGEDYKNAWKMTQIFKNTISNDLQHYMQKVTLPTLMIWGKDDDQAPVGEAKIMHGHIKNSSLHILEWSHFIHKEQPQEIMDLILQFR